VNYFFIIALLLPLAAVTQLPDGSYQVPDNWTGCFVNPDDLNDKTFGCPGPVGGPDDYKMGLSNVSEIIITLQNGTNIHVSP